MCGLKSHIKVHSQTGAFLETNESGKLEWISKDGVPVTLNEDVQETTFSCLKCDRKFLRKQDLRRHKQTHQENFKNKYCCSVCGTKFSRSDALFRHSKVKRCLKL